MAIVSGVIDTCYRYVYRGLYSTYSYLVIRGPRNASVPESSFRQCNFHVYFPALSEEGG